MKICIYGAGAIGGYMGLMLQLGRVHGVYPTYPEADLEESPEELAID